ncbi:MAG: hypothetical protein IMZ62_01680 [Chloroflexi bacterium]|nr:hypothetical protein [Chloroflexota bacterium]
MAGRIKRQDYLKICREQAAKKLFVSAPKAQDLRPNEKERYVLGELWDWQVRSARTPWMIGKPVGH